MNKNKNYVNINEDFLNKVLPLGGRTLFHFHWSVGVKPFFKERSSSLYVPSALPFLVVVVVLVVLLKKKRSCTEKNFCYYEVSWNRKEEIYIADSFR